MNQNKFSKVKLNNKTEMPWVGLGTYKIHGNDVIKSIKAAYEAGYRLIDTAKSYGNEKEIGDAIRDLGILREEIFITTKLDPSDHGYKTTLSGFEQSIEKLQLDYVDLYLIHWPNSSKRLESWKAFEELYSKGLCKAIGVSNYTESHLQELLNSSSVVPAVNQIEFNPFCFQNDILSFCKKKNIQVEGYSPLARMDTGGKEKLKQMAEKYSKTEAQVLLRWSIQHDVVVIPKSSSKERIKENIDIFDFELNDDEIKILNSFDKNLRYSPDPHNMK